MNQFGNYFKLLDVIEGIVKGKNEKNESEAERIARRPSPERFEAVEPPVPPTLGSAVQAGFSVDLQGIC
jgi:hypothetical protein